MTAGNCEEVNAQATVHLYEYAVIRLVPLVEREEFVNVGVIMMCKRRKWLRVELRPDLQRIAALAPDVDVTAPLAQLEVFNLVVKGVGAFGDMPVEERFRFLTAEKSTCVQTSRPHPGLSADLDATFAALSATYLP